MNFRDKELRDVQPAVEARMAEEFLRALDSLVAGPNEPQRTRKELDAILLAQDDPRARINECGVCGRKCNWPFTGLAWDGNAMDYVGTVICGEGRGRANCIEVYRRLKPDGRVYSSLLEGMRLDYFRSQAFLRRGAQRRAW